MDSTVPEFLVLDVMRAEVSESPGGNSATKNIFYENILNVVPISNQSNNVSEAKYFIAVMR